jgi:DNA-binding response OmpR family regulator
MGDAVVLLIEEHEPLRILYEQALEDEGYTVIAVGDCGEALNKVGATRPDVIVLEPTNLRYAHEAWLRLTQAAGHPPIIWNSGRPDYRERARAAGVAFVLKSSDVDTLCAQVQRVSGA